MADNPGLLGQIGQGLGTGLGTALTPLAMLMAARGGRDPFAILRAGKEDELANQIREQALATSRLTNVGTQAAGIADPAIRQYLGSHPEAAMQFGLETAPAGIAAPEYLERASVGPGMLPTPPGGDIGLLPPQAQTLDEARRQGVIADTDYQQFQNRFAQNLPPGMEIQTMGPSGITFARPGMRSVPEGTPGVTPTAEEPFPTLPSGEKAYVPPAKVARTAQQTANYLSKIKAARATIATVSGPLSRTDPTTGVRTPLVKPDGSPVTYRDALLGTGVGSSIFAELPGVPEMRARFLSRGAGWMGEGGQDQPWVADAAGALQSMQGSISAAARIGGEVGNLADKEQERFSQAFIPGPRDSDYSGPRKLAFFNETMDRIEAALASGASPGEIKALYLSATDQAERLTGAAGPATTSTTAGIPQPTNALPTAPTAQPTTTGGFPSPDEIRAAQAGLGAKGPKALRRATGGPVPKGRIALVGERGPELMAGPGTVYPTQMAQAAPPPQQMRSVGAAPGMGGGTQVPVDPGAVKPPRMIGGTLGAATAKPTPVPSGGIGVGMGLTDADRALLKAEPDKYGITLGPGNVPMLMVK